MKSVLKCLDSIICFLVISSLEFCGTTPLQLSCNLTPFGLTANAVFRLPVYHPQRKRINKNWPHCQIHQDVPTFTIRPKNCFGGYYISHMVYWTGIWSHPATHTHILACFLPLRSTQLVIDHGWFRDTLRESGQTNIVMERATCCRYISSWNYWISSQPCELAQNASGIIMLVN